MLVRPTAGPFRPAVPPADTSCLEVFEREVDYLFNTLRRLGVSPAEAEDLAQEVFVVLHRHWPTFDTSRPIRPYLFGIAVRIVAAHRRRYSRETLFAEVDTQDCGASPESSLQHKESVALLTAALERVPLSRSAVIILHDLDEVPVAEIARNLAITRFGVYSRLRRGRRELASVTRRLLKERLGK